MNMTMSVSQMDRQSGHRTEASSDGPLQRRPSSCSSTTIGTNVTASLQAIKRRKKRRVMFDCFTQLIQIFFGRMTANQRQLLKSGTPDETTTSLLAELLMNIVASVSNGYLATLQKLSVTISPEDVQARLGNTLCKSFAEVLGVQDTLMISWEDFEVVRALVVREVSENVNSILSSPHPEEHFVNQRFSHPLRLNAMLQHTLSMLNRLMRSIPVPEMEDLLEEEEGEAGGAADTPSDENTSDEEVFVAASSRSAPDIIRDVVDTLIMPLLEEVGDEYDLLQTNLSVELERVADVVTHLLSKDNKGFDKKCEGNIKSKHRRKAYLKGARRIKAFLAKCRAKAWILSMVAQHKKISQQYRVERESRHTLLNPRYTQTTAHVSSTSAINTDALHHLFELIDSLFVFEEGLRKTPGCQLCVFPRLKDILQGQDTVFSKQLSEMIFMFIKSRKMPKSRKRKAGSNMVMPTIDDLINIFLSVMNWWLQTQGDHHVDKVMVELTAMQLHDVLHEENETIFSEEAAAAAQIEKKKIAVMILVEQIVSRIFKRSRPSWGPDDHIIMERVFGKVWAEVECMEITITAKMFLESDTLVFQKLCEKYEKPKLMRAPTSKEAVIEELIVSLVKERLVALPKLGLQVPPLPVNLWELYQRHCYLFI